MTAAASRARTEEPRPTLHLFDACGLEIEYMLVDRASLDVRPIADRVLQDLSGSDKPVNDYVKAGFGWSNELVMHVLELKNTQPATDIAALGPRFQQEVRDMNRALEQHGVQLMPGGMHPWMNPRSETRIWPHENASIYRMYDRLFDCKNHGWSNLQATHVNLPFADDEEFARLHAAVRVVLPILPALAAASPYADGRASSVLDYRMEVYRANADSIPELNGRIVPDPVTTRAEYERTMLEPLYRAIAPHDPQGLLQHEWLNARGAIARFDRSALEIRVLDTQECPLVDTAFAALVMDLAASLCERTFRGARLEAQLPTRMLDEIFVACCHDADRTHIAEPEYLALFGLMRRECSAADLWSAIAERLERENALRASLWRGPLEYVLTRGPLAKRLLRAIGPRPSRAALHELYSALAAALDSGKPFDP